MRSSRERLADIVEHIQHAQAFTTGMTLEDFERDVMVQYATTRCLEIISEASRHVRPDLKQRYPEIRWQQIAGAGNVYRHDYEMVSAEIIWGTVQNALPPLLAVVVAELASD